MDRLFLCLDSHQQPSVKYTSVAPVQAFVSFLFICTPLQVGAAALPAEPCKHRPRQKWPCCHFPGHCFEDRGAVGGVRGSPERCVYACPQSISVLWRVCLQTTEEERGALAASSRSLSHKLTKRRPPGLSSVSREATHKSPAAWVYLLL